MGSAIVRGLMIGGSLAVIVSLFGIVDPPKALLLGLVAGLFAGITRYRLQKGYEKKNRGE